VDKTDGVPLFVEELTKAVIESNLVTDAGDRYELSGDVDIMRVPATLHDSLMARLDRLIPMKEVAQIGAAIGREFSYRLLAAVSPMSPSELQAALQRIVESELVHRRGVPPDSVYVFKHALVQDAAYDSMLRRRRIELHHRIAEALEREFPETIETEPELVAHHYTAAGATGKAVPYWLKAGQRALRASALTESVDHLSRGLKLLLMLPETVDRDAREIDFQAALGTALMMWKDYANAATGAAYLRADVLMAKAGDSPQQFPVLWGVWAYYLVQADYEQTLAAAKRALAVAGQSGDRALLVQALSLNCVTMFWLGRYLEAKAFTEQVLEIYDEAAHGPQVWVYNHDAKNLCFIYAAMYLWMLGYPDQAARIDEEQAAQARRLGHPFLIAFGDFWGGSVWHFRADEQRHAEVLRGVERLSKEQGYPLWEAGAAMYEGWWLVQNGDVNRGLEMLERSHNGWLATGATNIGPYQRALVADAYSRSGRDAEACNWIDAAIEWMEQVDERCHEAEVHRLKGDILLRGRPRDEAGAEAAYVKSLEIARRQQARSWELRTATSYARLLIRQGRPDEARALLQPVYDWFTEGFDTKDRQDARAVLNDAAVAT
jgi:predicted ATPase